MSASAALTWEAAAREARGEEWRSVRAERGEYSNKGATVGGGIVVDVGIGSVVVWM